MAEKGTVEICFISPKAYPLFDSNVKSVFGGAEVDLYMLATELAKDDAYEVSFIVADYGQPAEQTLQGVRVIKSLDFKKNPMAGAVRVWGAMKRADADIYMIKTASPGVPLGAWFCKINKKAFIYRTAHKVECDGTFVKEHFILGKAFKWALKKARLVFVQNESDKEMIKQTIGVDSIDIPNGHRLDAAGEQERNCVLWVGRSAAFKRPEIFIDLAKKFPELDFVMICRPATGDKMYSSLANNANIIPNIRFHEEVAFSEIDGFFQRAKVFVNTSEAEGFANTFIQACRAGTAILSLDVNPDGFLDEYSCGVCCEGNTDKLAAELKSMIIDERYTELGENGRKYAAEKHDITKIALRYKEYFEEITG